MFWRLKYLLNSKKYRYVDTSEELIGVNFTFKGSCSDGDPFYIKNYNVWDYNWSSINKYVKVRDPRYHQEFKMKIYQLNIENEAIQFAAGELPPKKEEEHSE